MLNLLKRVRKLETRFTDVSGFVPYSAEWYKDWYERATCF